MNLWWKMLCAFAFVFTLFNQVRISVSCYYHARTFLWKKFLAPKETQDKMNEWWRWNEKKMWNIPIRQMISCVKVHKRRQTQFSRLNRSTGNSFFNKSFFLEKWYFFCFTSFFLSNCSFCESVVEYIHIMWSPMSWMVMIKWIKFLYFIRALRSQHS